LEEIRGATEDLSWIDFWVNPAFLFSGFKIEKGLTGWKSEII
jgi:hypothetical protein